MGLRSVVSRASGAVLLAVALTPAASANDAQLLLETGDEIPGTSKKIGGISDAWLDGENVIWTGEDGEGSPGFGQLKWTPSPELKWNPVDPSTLEKKASLSGPGFAYLGMDAAGTPTIFGMADVESWNPRTLVRLGQTLPGGGAVTELGSFDLSGKKLVFATNSGIYSIDDIGKATLDYKVLVDTTTEAPGLGLFQKFHSVFTSAEKVFFSAESEGGEGAYLYDSINLHKVRDTTDQIPIDNVSLNFSKIKAEAWTGKKAILSGSADVNEGVFYTGEIIPGAETELGTVTDTNTELPDGGGLFQKIRKISANDWKVAVYAEGSNGSLGIYTGFGNLSKKWIDAGGEAAGKRFSSISMTDQSLGSLIFTAAFGDGSEGLLLADTTTAVPLLPMSGITLLLAVAIATVAYAWIVRGRHPQRT